MLSVSRHPIRDSRRKGVALIIVLAILILVTALVVGFLVRTGSERTAAASYRATARTRQLADTVVNLVQAQINQATVATTGSATTSGSAWASQPGAIRVFDGLGNQTIYKLYSSPTMVTGSYGNIAGDMPFSTGSSVWMSSPSLWVDLNAPAAFTISGSPALAYPIIDPRNPTGGDFTSGTSASAGMAGFQVNPALIGGTASSTSPIAPMPAQWLYVLQDGTIVPPNLAQSTGTSVILSATNVSASNPIVGRIAFWTDDDTCRLNINTAGDGTFWDTPHFTAPDDYLLAYYSPQSYEYQRYPGHPATTSLLPVLSAVNPVAFPPSTTPPPTAIALTNSTVTYTPYQTVAYTNLFGSTVNGSFTPGLLPQYAYGGSQEGTVPELTSGFGAYGATVASSTNVTPFNSQRLFTSVGEMLFLPNTSTTPTARVVNPVWTQGGENPRQEMETAKFFLTAHSRAPELNLFGTPRVSIWPFTIGTSSTGGSTVSLSGTYIVPASIRNTPTDQLLAFASTINGSGIDPFYFMRASNVNPNTDIGITRNGALQNQQVLTYLENLMSQPIPGFGAATFEDAAKYGQMGARQILTEIFDYVRTTDTLDGAVVAKGPLNSFGFPNPVYNFGQDAVGGGAAGHVVPTLNTMWTSGTSPLQGYGTYPRPTCITLHFVGLGNGQLTSGSATNVPILQYSYSNYAHDASITTGTDGSGVVSAGRVAVQAFIYVQFVIPASGRVDSQSSPIFGIQFTGLDTLGVTTPDGTTTPLGFAASTAIQSYGTNLSGGWGFWGNDQFTGQIPIMGEMGGGRVSGNSAGDFPFYSQIVGLPYVYSNGSSNKMTLTGGNNAAMKLYDISGNLIQTIALNFNAAAQAGGPLPFPVNPAGVPGTLAASGSTNTASLTPLSPFSGYFLSMARLIGTPANSGTLAWDVTLNDRWAAGLNPAYYFDPSHDVTASLVLNPPWDDPRMLAMTNVPSTAFTAHTRWGQQMAHDLTYSMGFDPFLGNSGSGGLVMNATYPTPGVTNSRAVLPCVRSSSTNGVAFTGGTNVASGYSFGDWDNGVSVTSDGPWINRADEGGATTGAQYSPTMFYLPYFTGGNGSVTMGAGIFSPNREIPSPVTFGSLPTGVDPSGANPKPWQTLLFRPGAVINHPGAGVPVNAAGPGQVPMPPYRILPDHLLLDLFWMPVAEPYAISEPFSTAGKVNLNYQILPFGYISATTGATPYIRRDTGIRSALTGLQIGAVPLGSASTYKSLAGNWWGQFGNVSSFVGDNGGNLARLPIDINQTFQQFDTTFENGQIFESASQICDLYLVPAGYTYLNFSGAAGGAGSWYGNDFAMVGDNVRERPYADLYSRVTTKSNTFTVYFTVQELKNSPASPANQWNESSGTIVGEYRGSKDMERYIQQNAIPDLLANPAVTGSTSLESFYRWRILEDNRFSP